LMRLPRPYMQGDDAKNQKPFKLHGSTWNVCRKSGEPYIFHPIEARIVVEENGIRNNPIICALLHDVVEDSAIPLLDWLEKSLAVTSQNHWWLAKSSSSDMFDKKSLNKPNI
jgi:hypothetical protein